MDINLNRCEQEAEARFFLGIPVAKRKFAELELSLLHLQQNVEIPEVHLVIQSPIQKAVEAVGDDPCFKCVRALTPLVTNSAETQGLESP